MTGPFQSFLPKLTSTSAFSSKNTGQERLSSIHNFILLTMTNHDQENVDSDAT